MERPPLRVLVTGASGFIGGHTCNVLSQAGATVRALVRRTSDIRHLEKSAIEICYGDLSDPDSLRSACKNIDIVVHTAAVVGSFGDWSHYYEIGVLGTERLIEAAHQEGVARFVHLSSIAVYGLKPHGKPVTESVEFDHVPQSWNHYVREKVISEELIWKAHAAGKIRATTLRPSIVIGARDRNAVPRMIDMLTFPISLMAGKPSNRLPIVCIDDCVDAIARVVEKDDTIGKSYNISGHRHIAVADVLQLVGNKRNLRVPSTYLPTSLLFAPVGLLEWGWAKIGKSGEPPITRISIVLAGYDYEISCERAHQELGWFPKDEYESALEAALATV
jgi:nucleoside-diphosphate-sugar epimerase